MRSGMLGMALRKPADVHLVDDRVVPRRARRPIVAPGERRIDDGGQRGEGGVVAVVARQVGVRDRRRDIRTFRRPIESYARPTSRMDP